MEAEQAGTRSSLDAGDAAAGGGSRAGLWTHARRAVALALTAASLYLVFPSLLAVFDAWPSLAGVRPRWFA